MHPKSSVNPIAPLVEPAIRMLVLLGMCLLAQGSYAQPTAITYQGRLNNNGEAASGLYDLRFTLYDAANSGSIVGGPLTNTAVLVTNGLFNATMDFGNVFSGANRWLEIAVRGNGSSFFSPLNPRQPITSSPYSIRAAGVADGVITAPKLSPGSGANGQVLKMNGSTLAWATDLNSGGTVASVGSGTGLTGGPITSVGTLSIDTAVVPLLNANQIFSGSNTFNGGSSFNHPANRFTGLFFGNGAGLTNLSSSGTNITFAGDVTGTSGANTVARIRGVNVLAAAPVVNQVLRYNGSSWTPGGIALATDVAGTLGVANGGLGLSSYVVGDLLYASAPNALARLPDVVAGNVLVSGGVGVAPGWGKIGLATHVAGSLGLANGGTGAGTAGAARTNLGAAASGANTDITSLAGLITPISVAQGGSGHTTYGLGDILYASGSATLSRRAAGSAGQVLGIAGGFPAWTNGNAHNHFGQNWMGSANDGMFIINASMAEGSSALTGSSTSTNVGVKYGVFGQALSADGVGVQGKAFGPSGLSSGVAGESLSPDGAGVYGLASAGSGAPTGVYGEAYANNGIGVYGLGTASTGVPIGVYGAVNSASGYGLYTQNRLFVGDVAFFADHISMQAAARVFADAGSPAIPSLSFGASPSAGLFNPVVNVIGFSTSGTERMRIAADGKVGMGRVPTLNLLELAGNASKTVAGSWLANSDARIKTEIGELQNALDTIDRVRPVSFRYTQEYRESHPEIEDKTYCNVIAQEFAEVFPQAVQESGETLNGQPILQVDTHPAAMYAIAAIKELHGLVKDRDAELARLKEQNAALEKRLSALERSTDSRERKVPLAGNSD
jgi:hypothetical protein